MAKDKKQAALGFIFITLLIDVMGFGIIIPVMPKMIQQLEHCTVEEASKYGGWLLAAYAIMQFLCAPILGNLSDKYGRRAVLLFSLFGFGLDYLLTGFAPNILWLFAGRTIAGITGASFSTASAYIADVSPPEKKAQNFGMIGAAFGMGFIIGPSIGSLLSGFGPRACFFTAAGLAFINWLYGFFILPESLSKENRRPFDWKRANPVGALLHLRKFPVISGLVASLTLLYIAAHAIQSNWSFYTIGRYQWSEKMVGYSLSFVGLLIGLVQGGLTRIVIPKLGQEKSVYVGLGLYAIGLVLFGLATEGWMMFVFLVPYALGGIAGPALQGIISNHVPANEQGALQGALTSLMSVTAVIGPPLMTNTFAFSSNNKYFHFPGLVMMLAAFLAVISTLLAYRTLKHEK